MLKLIRYPLFVTAGIDSVTGYLVITPSPRVSEVLLYAILSCALFIFGVVLNDLIDIRKDIKLKENRPLATGEVTKTSAVLICLFSLAIVSLISLKLPDYRQSYKVLAIVLLILAYNLLFKELPQLNALSMGLIRAVNITLAHPLNTPALYFPSITHFCYIFLCTNISFIEKKPGEKRLLLILIISSLIYSFLFQYNSIRLIYALFPVILFIITFLVALRETKKFGEVRSIPKLISLLVILDIFYLFITDIL